MLILTELLAAIGSRRVVDDSRVVQPGDVFVWDSRIAPARGTAPLVDAQGRGASLLVSDLAFPSVQQVPDAGAFLAAWAAAHWPRQPQVMLGVTGTSGKTSVAWFVRQLAAACGHKAASVGTLGVMRSDTDADEDYTGFTSPTALKLHPILDRLVAEGVTHTSLEVSSHALVLQRVEGVRFAAAGITNMTQDHLDFHGTLEAYHAAKLRLFSEVLPGPESGKPGVAVVNVNRPECWPAAVVAKGRGCPVLTTGTANAELVVQVEEASPRGLTVNLKFDATPVALTLPLIGDFQAENVALALGLAVGGGSPWAQVARAAAQLTGVPGRMEVVPSAPTQPAVVVDYAHKPDALQRALQSLRPVVKPGGKLRVVFGCGGNRDAGKRPIMGRIAAQLADDVYVTDDNPRFEDADAIRAQVMAGVQEGGAKGQNIGDRRAAIAAALNASGPDDVVLVAGKGHEHGQIVGDAVLPFDDRTVCRNLLSGL